MAGKYKVGDLVQLKSGGPVMTVADLSPGYVAANGTSGNIRCQWFAGKKLESGSFDVSAVIAAKEEKKNE